MKVEQFTRKSFNVDAVQVTTDNMEEVAAWCQGDIRVEDDIRYIKVRVHNPINEQQSKAYVSDWVLYAGKGYKVYKNSAFKKSFDSNEITVNPEDIDTNQVNALNVFAGSDQIAVGPTSTKNPGGTNSI